MSTGDGWAHYIARPLSGNIFPNLVASQPANATANAAANAAAATAAGDGGRRMDATPDLGFCIGYTIPSWAQPTIRRPVTRARAHKHAHTKPTVCRDRPICAVTSSRVP